MEILLSKDFRISMKLDVSENSGVFPPNHPILIGFSIIFTIHLVKL